MAYSRRLGVVGILSACWLVAAVGCSDDEDRKNNSGDAGEGGDDGGGKGGTPSAGGNANNGGKAGTAGNGGSAGSSSSGDAGSGTAGDAGSGSGGDAGSGSVAGAGGEGGSGTTGGGGEGGLSSSGAGGEGGEPAAPVAKSCVSLCEDDDECVSEAGFAGKCDDSECVECLADADCNPKKSDWFAPCETTADCEDEYFACVDYRGGTYCAILDNPENGAGCADLGDLEAVTATLHEGGTEIDVCVNPVARCFDGKCGTSCETICPADEGDTCNPVSGRCECQNSTECGDGLVCVNNLCTECAIDDDCPGDAEESGHTKCVAGKCGCSDVNTCHDPYPDAPNACQ